MLAVTCTSLFSIYANITFRKNVDANFVYYITGYIHSNLGIFSPASWQLCFHAKKNSAQYFKYQFFTERILKLEKSTNLTYLRQMPQHFWIKLHLTHTVYYLRNKNQQDSLFFLFKFISMIILLVLITQIYHDARPKECQTVYYV